MIGTLNYELILEANWIIHKVASSKSLKINKRENSITFGHKYENNYN